MEAWDVFCKGGMPKMILFDYGQTLVKEQKFDGVKGTSAVLEYASKNPYNITAMQVQAHADELNKEFGRFTPGKQHLFQIEIPNTMFTPYLYESLGIEIALSNEEIDRVFWEAAAPGTPTDGIQDFLIYLRDEGIRTGVISNISYQQKVVVERIRRLLPDHDFEFVLASSQYIYRKPNHRIFDLAFTKAGLEPDKVWYIGDNYECDVNGARQAGMHPIWYTGASEETNEDNSVLTIASWQELQMKMEKIGRDRLHGPL